jgi:hypothetical protein
VRIKGHGDMDTLSNTEAERMFTPSAWRMILTHDALVFVFLLLYLLPGRLADFTKRSLDEIIYISIFALGFSIFAMFITTLIYGLNREVFSIKLDDISITGPYWFGSKRILRSEIDPAWSRYRNMIDRLFKQWHIRDINGTEITISGLNFRPDEIEEILKTVGVEMT